MDQLTISLLVIFVLVTVVPFFAKRLGVPVIVAELVAGIILGVSWLNMLPDHQMIEWLSSFGLVYLMFLAGIEVDMRVVKKYLQKTLFVALASVAVPFLSGWVMAPYYSISPLLLGTILCTTSLGLILPMFRELEGRERYRQVLLGSVVLVDIFSMFLLAFTLSYMRGHLDWTFWYSIVMIFVIFVLPFVILQGKIREVILHWVSKQIFFDMEVRFCFALVFVLGALSEAFGFHGIIGAFVAGVLVTEFTEKNSPLEEKMKSFGYGFFIPLFFIIIGSKVNIPALFAGLQTLESIVVLIFVAVLAKVAGVGLVAKVQGYTTRDSLALGFFHSARLSLIIAAAEIVRREGFFDANMFSMFVLLAIVTAIIGPSVGRYLALGQKA
jgi:Kef-type K+ transport system membrane component KefB